MQRHLWLDSLSRSWCPPWPCPICKTGRVVLRQGSVNSEETVESKREHNEDYWGPEYLELIFSAWADCNNEHCKQSFVIAGKGGIENFIDDNTEESSWEERYNPTSVTPAPGIIDIPAACPRALRDLFFDAFRLYWTDAESCAGKIRVSVEALLTHLGVPTSDGTDNNNPRRLSLHRRIELLEKTNPEPARLLMAIKWMGNAGSHGGGVFRRDTLDALEILEHILPELLERRSQKMQQLAERLVRRHKQ